MLIDTGSFKRAVRSLKAFSRRRFRTSFPLVPSPSEKQAIQASGHDRHQGSLASDSLLPSDFESCPSNSRVEHTTSATPKRDSPSTDTANPAGLPSAYRNNSPQFVCPICGNFDTRLHLNGNDPRHAAEHEQAGAAGTTGRSSLPFSLLWETELQGSHEDKPLHAQPRRKPSQHYLPSWSPAPLLCPVGYNQEDCTSESLCRVLDVACELAISDRSLAAAAAAATHGDRSTLTIQALIFELECRMDPGSDRVELIGTIPGDGAIDWSVTMAHDVLPPRSVAREWGCVKENLLFLPVALRETSREHAARHELTIKGLALRRVAGTSNLCTRIGTVKLRFCASMENSLECWQHHLGSVATGEGEKIVTII
ncbi:hypothetical protein OQA88_4849 [Cercophora sp. LCS_1]